MLLLHKATAGHRNNATRTGTHKTWSWDAIYLLEPGPNQHHTTEYKLAVGLAAVWCWKKVSTLTSDTSALETQGESSSKAHELIMCLVKQELVLLGNALWQCHHNQAHPCSFWRSRIGHTLRCCSSFCTSTAMCCGGRLSTSWSQSQIFHKTLDRRIWTKVDRSEPPPPTIQS